MSYAQRTLTYIRQNPIAVYFGGAVFLSILRQRQVGQAYQQNFARYDVERRQELERFLAEGNLPPKKNE